MPREPKTPVQVRIPVALVQFLRDVARRISNGDKATKVESDDLLQCDSAYGGLIDSQAGLFGFVYFPGDGGEATWELLLDAQQIQDIATGTITDLSLWKCSSKACSNLFPSEDAYCPECDSIRYFDDYRVQLLIQHPHESEATLTAMERLRKIVLAILDYQEAHDGKLPPAYTTDASGQRLHSWRSLILPYLGLAAVYNRINFTQPWNANTNRAVADEIPDVYASEQRPTHHTGIFAIAGPNTLWPGNSTRRLSDIQSGTSYTVVVIEAANASVHWMDPRDIELRSLCAKYDQYRPTVAAFADGHVETVTHVGYDQFKELAEI